MLSGPAAFPKHICPIALENSWKDGGTDIHNCVGCWGTFNRKFSAVVVSLLSSLSKWLPKHSNMSEPLVSTVPSDDRRVPTDVCFGPKIFFVPS